MVEADHTSTARSGEGSLARLAHLATPSALYAAQPPPLRGYSRFCANLAASDALQRHELQQQGRLTTAASVGEEGGAGADGAEEGRYAYRWELCEVLSYNDVERTFCIRWARTQRTKFVQRSVCARAATNHMEKGSAEDSAGDNFDGGW